MGVTLQICVTLLCVVAYFSVHTEAKSVDIATIAKRLFGGAKWGFGDGSPSGEQRQRMDLRMSPPGEKGHPPAPAPPEGCNLHEYFNECQDKQKRGARDPALCRHGKTDFTDEVRSHYECLFSKASEDGRCTDISSELKAAMIVVDAKHAAENCFMYKEGCDVPIFAKQCRAERGHSDPATECKDEKTDFTDDVRSHFECIYSKASQDSKCVDILSQEEAKLIAIGAEHMAIRCAIYRQGSVSRRDHQRNLMNQLIDTLDKWNSKKRRTLGSFRGRHNY